MNNPMQLSLNLPEKLEHKEPMNVTWQMWKNQFLMYMHLTDSMKKSTRDRSYILQNLMGKVGIETVGKINFNNPNEKEDMDILLTKLGEYFDPPENEILARYKFFSRTLRSNEDIHQFIEDLKILSLMCRFGDDADKMVIDRLILNLDDATRRIVFDKGTNVNIDYIVINYRKMQIKREQFEQSSKETNAIALQRPYNYGPSKFCGLCHLEHIPDNCPENKQLYKKPCWRCGTVHGLHECPAWKSYCQICNKRDHFTGRCRDSKLDQSDQRELGKENLKCNLCGLHHSQLVKCTHPKQYIDLKNYPYDVCYSCRKNPHSKWCNVREQITLPNVNVKSLCSWCNTSHFENECLHKLSCDSCNEYFDVHVRKFNLLQKTSKAPAASNVYSQNITHSGVTNATTSTSSTSTSSTSTTPSTDDNENPPNNTVFQYILSFFTRT